MITLYSKKKDNNISKIIDSLRYITIASIDVGTKNFCIKIEQRLFDYKEGIMITNDLIYDKKDLGKDHENSLIEYFNEIWETIKILDIVIIEKQVGSNTKMMVFEKFIESYFNFWVASREDTKLKVVKVLGASIKYSRLDINTKGINKKKLKQIISPNIACQILEFYNQIDCMYTINLADKKDDYSDVVLLIEAFLRKYDKNNKFHIPNIDLFLY